MLTISIHYDDAWTRMLHVVMDNKVNNRVSNRDSNKASKVNNRANSRDNKCNSRDNKDNKGNRDSPETDSKVDRSRASNKVNSRVVARKTVAHKTARGTDVSMEDRRGDRLEMAGVTIVKSAPNGENVYARLRISVANGEAALRPERRAGLMMSSND